MATRYDKGGKGKYIVGAGALLAIGALLYSYLGDKWPFKGDDKLGISKTVQKAVKDGRAMLREKKLKRPLVVFIDGYKYMVKGKETPLETVLEMATKVPSGQGPAVRVVMKGTSKAGAEDKIMRALKKKKVYTIKVPEESVAQ